MSNLGLSLPRSISLREQVTETLRHSILFGTLKPGQKLVERQICEEMGISRTVLREALQHLDAEGLLINGRRGRSVVSIGMQEAREIDDTRQALERLIAESFVRNAGKAEIAELRVLLSAMETADDEREALMKEREFFTRLADGCGNKVAAGFFRQLSGRVAMLSGVAKRDGANRQQRMAEIRAIVEAIDAGDAEKAGSLCASRAAADAAYR